MPTNFPEGPRRNIVSRSWYALTHPSARWSVLSILVLGFLVAGVAIVGTQVMVQRTGTNEFCGTACHSMQWVAAEYNQSVHHLNRTGVQAGCHDCHIPHSYPQVLVYKVRAGVHDALAEAKGVIDTEAKFKKE